MPPTLRPPITCLITDGETTPATTPRCDEFARVLALVRRAAAARVSLVQLREKNLRPSVLYELAGRAARLTRDTGTLLLVNDRADLARAAGADGVHLTTRSLEASVVRRVFGGDFLIGVSAHTLAEAAGARAGGADFAVFGPVFDTPSKRQFGPPLGLPILREAAGALAPFPLVAIGGVARDNIEDVLQAGASGVAAIRLFADADTLAQTVQEIETLWQNQRHEETGGDDGGRE